MTKIYSQTQYSNAKKEFSIPEGVQELTFDASTNNAVDEHILEKGWFNVKE